MAACRTDNAGITKRCIRCAALAAALGGSALFLAVAMGSASASCLAWISLVPLYAAIRRLDPLWAAVAGAGWGAGVYCFSIAGAAPVVAPTLPLLITFSTVPALYAGLSALACRAIGFNPVVLGFGWIAVELALGQLGLQRGLLAATQDGGVLLDWVGRPLGYVFVALLVACANASALAVLSAARLRMPRSRSVDARPSDAGARHSSAQIRLHLQLFALRQVYPRAPPSMPASATS